MSASIETESSAIALRTKLKVVNYGCVFACIAGTLYLAGKLYHYRSFGADEFSLILVVFSFAGLFIYARASGNVLRAGSLFNLLLLVFIPMRVIMTGGLSSPVIFGYVAHCVCVLMFHERAWGMACFVWSMASIVVIGFLERWLDLSGAYASEVSVFTGWGEVTMLALVTLPVLFLIEERDQMIEAYRKLEKLKSSHSVMRRINHEVGNSLAVASGLLELYKEERDPQLLESMRSALYEIEEVARVMERTALKGDLVDMLNKNKDAIHILQKLRPPPSEVLRK